MPLGLRLKPNIAALTASELTDNTGATASDGLAAISGSGDDSAININFASLAATQAAIIADLATIRAKIND